MYTCMHIRIFFHADTHICEWTGIQTDILNTLTHSFEIFAGRDETGMHSFIFKGSSNMQV